MSYARACLDNSLPSKFTKSRLPLHLDQRVLRIEMNREIVAQQTADSSRALCRYPTNFEWELHPSACDPGLVLSFNRLIRPRPLLVEHSHGWILYSLFHSLLSQETRFMVTMHEKFRVCRRMNFVYAGERCDARQYTKNVAPADAQLSCESTTAVPNGTTIARCSLRRVDVYIGVSIPVARAHAAIVEGQSSRSRDFDTSPSPCTAIDGRLHSRYCCDDHARSEDDGYKTRVKPRDTGDRETFEPKPVQRLECDAMTGTSSLSR